MLNIKRMLSSEKELRLPAISEGSSDRNQPAILTEEMSVRRSGSIVLDCIDLNIPSGAIYALLGPNGGGKTTLLKALLNMILVESGSVTILGKDSRRLSGDLLSRVAYVSEDQEMPEWMTVTYFLDYLRSFYPKWDSSLEHQLRKQLNLPLTKRIRDLSRGQRIQLKFLSSFAYHPSLIILDEPFSGLDALKRDELVDIFLEQAQEATILLSSHDLVDLDKFATHIGFLADGKLLFSEELSSLVSRFRQVDVTLPSIEGHHLISRQPVPASWVLCEHFASTLRIIHCRASSEAVEEQVSMTYPSAISIRQSPMTIHSIFAAVAKSGCS